MLAGKVKLVDLVRPYFTPILAWNAGSVIPVAGGGVVLEAIKEARAKERMKKQTAPYFDALEGEVIYHKGDLKRALSLSRRALRNLPREEVLLRGRVSAWAADASRRVGHLKEAEKHFYHALQKYPTALRILGIKLPVRILTSPDTLSHRIGRVLMRSRRLQPRSSHGYLVRVTRREDVVFICLESPAGRRISCASKKLPSKGTDEEKVALAIDVFHNKAFAPKIDLTQKDINSLDGSAVRGDADQLIDKVLGK